METFSALLSLCEGNPPGTGGFPPQRPVTRSFDVFFDLRLNKRLSKTIEVRVIWEVAALIMTYVFGVVIKLTQKMQMMTRNTSRLCVPFTNMDQLKSLHA